MTSSPTVLGFRTSAGEPTRLLMGYSAMKSFGPITYGIHIKVSRLADESTDDLVGCLAESLSAEDEDLVIPLLVALARRKHVSESVIAATAWLVARSFPAGETKYLREVLAAIPVQRHTEILLRPGQPNWPRFELAPSAETLAAARVHTFPTGRRIYEAETRIWPCLLRQQRSRRGSPRHADGARARCTRGGGPASGGDAARDEGEARAAEAAHCVAGTVVVKTRSMRAARATSPAEHLLEHSLSRTARCFARMNEPVLLPKPPQQEGARHLGRAWALPNRARD